MTTNKLAALKPKRKSTIVRLRMQAIENAIAAGCSHEQIATALTEETGVEITAATLSAYISKERKIGLMQHADDTNRPSLQPNNEEKSSPKGGENETEPETSNDVGYSKAPMTFSDVDAILRTPVNLDHYSRKRKK